MALNLGPGQEYVISAIVIGVILLACQLAGLSLGALGNILYAAAIVLLVVWALTLFGILS